MSDGKLDSLPIGFLMGFFLGCIGLVLSFVIGGDSTKRGAIMGFVGALAMGLCLGVCSGGLQVFLASSGGY
jgi:hypothetical protein